MLVNHLAWVLICAILVFVTHYVCLFRKNLRYASHQGRIKPLNMPSKCEAKLKTEKLRLY